MNLSSKDLARRSAVVAILLGGVLLAGVTAWADDSEGGRVFEMRTYTTTEDNLDSLHTRFREHTIGLFKKHGIDVIAFWTPQDDETSQNTLVYVLGYADLEARKKAWAAFLADPEWQKAYAESIKDGKLVKRVESEFLTPTDYSPLK